MSCGDRTILKVINHVATIHECTGIVTWQPLAVGESLSEIALLKHRKMITQAVLNLRLVDTKVYKNDDSDITIVERPPSTPGPKYKCIMDAAVK